MISLVSIVRNEAANIDRFLDSALAVCGSATLVDTGSTDDTMDRVHARGLEVTPIPWAGFGHARTIAFEMAKVSGADWLLCLDADMTAEIDPGFEPDPAVDAYLIEVGTPDFRYRLPLLLNGQRAWVSHGRVHEYTTLADGSLGRREPTDAVRITSHSRGGSPEKYHRYLELLEQDRADDPTNPRTIFYLAQTHSDVGQYPQAIEWYDKRVAMGGWVEETYVAALRAARLTAWPERRDRLWAAWQMRPSRLEAPYSLARGLNEHDDHVTAYAVASVPSSVPCEDVLFVETGAWQYGLLFEKSVASFYVGQPGECRALTEQVLAIAGLPANIRAAAERNLTFC